MNSIQLAERIKLNHEHVLKIYRYLEDRISLKRDIISCDLVLYEDTGETVLENMSQTLIFAIMLKAQRLWYWDDLFIDNVFTPNPNDPPRQP
jgi:hypothetical protein